LLNTGDIGGATSNQLTITGAQLTNSGYYLVIVANAGGVVTSSVAQLTVTASPVIVSQPTDQAIAVGATASFSVAAVGMTPLYYQWQFNSNDLVRATNSTLIVTNVQTTNTGFYRVVVTNVVGSVTSSNAFLDVTNIPPAIVVQPTNQIVAVGSNVTLVVTATGTLPLSYQWWLAETNQTNQIVDGGNISGANSATLVITNAQTTNTGTYFVIITNYGGSVTSSNAVLTVGDFPPVITTQPTNQLVEAGLTVTNVVAATGTPPLHYRWQINETNLVDGTTSSGSTSSGSTNDTLYIYSAQTNDSGNYRVIITNYWGTATSSVAVLTVTKAPLITVQPTNQTVWPGSTVSFFVDGYATPPYSLHWLKNGTVLTDVTNISGSIITGSGTVTLTIANAQMSDSGTYWLVVSNAWGTVATSNAVLTVTLPSFASIVAAGGGSFILSGTGGVNNNLYYVLATTNLTLPFTNWTSIATDQFDNLGGFIFTNAAPTNTSQLFYILQIQPP
jgi:hypothetical protein